MYQQNIENLEIDQGYDQNTNYKSLLNNEEVRLNFIRKVYSILSIQLLFTSLFVIIAYISQEFAQFQLQNSWLFYILFFIAIISELSIICCKSSARTVPLNYVLLAVFTFCQAWIVSYSCSVAYIYYPQNGGQLVLIAAILTLGITCSLTLYAYTTKTDFTMAGGSLFIVGCALMLLGLFAAIFNSPFLYMFYTCCAAVLYGFYLIYDTQLIIGGRDQELSIDDYIIAALIIYVDIILLFLQLLRILTSLFGKE